MKKINQTNQLTWVRSLYLGVFIKTLQDVPSPVSILGFLCESVQVEKAFYRFWSQEVVSVCRLEHRTINQR